MQTTNIEKLATKTFINGVEKPDLARRVVGPISGKTFVVPDTTSGFPKVNPMFFDRKAKTKSSAPNMQAITAAYPDFGSPTLKIGMFVPSTNTAMEQECWSILKKADCSELNGVGIHTVNVLTPKPQVGTAGEVEQYKQAFLGGLERSLTTVLMAEPQYLIMGMSLEHIIDNMEEMDAPMRQIVEGTPGGNMGMSTWHDAICGALNTIFPLSDGGNSNLGRKLRVGLMTPFDESGNENAIGMFENEKFFGRGMEVTRSYIFQCATTIDIAHISDAAKEMAVQMLATKENPDDEDAGVDVIIQCGTNFDMNRVAEKMEPLVGVPVLGINAVLLDRKSVV